MPEADDRFMKAQTAKTWQKQIGSMFGNSFCKHITYAGLHCFSICRTAAPLFGRAALLRFVLFWLIISAEGQKNPLCLRDVTNTVSAIVLRGIAVFIPCSFPVIFEPFSAFFRGLFLFVRR